MGFLPRRPRPRKKIGHGGPALPTTYDPATPSAPGTPPPLMTAGPATSSNASKAVVGVVIAVIVVIVIVVVVILGGGKNSTTTRGDTNNNTASGPFYPHAYCTDCSAANLGSDPNPKIGLGTFSSLDACNASVAADLQLANRDDSGLHWKEWCSTSQNPSDTPPPGS